MVFKTIFPYYISNVTVFSSVLYVVSGPNSFTFPFCRVLVEFQFRGFTSFPLRFLLYTRYLFIKIRVLYSVRGKWYKHSKQLYYYRIYIYSLLRKKCITFLLEKYTVDDKNIFTMNIWRKIMLDPMHTVSAKHEIASLLK